MSLFWPSDVLPTVCSRMCVSPSRCLSLSLSLSLSLILSEIDTLIPALSCVPQTMSASDSLSLSLSLSRSLWLLLLFSLSLSLSLWDIDMPQTMSASVCLSLSRLLCLLLSFSLSLSFSVRYRYLYSCPWTCCWQYAVGYIYMQDAAVCCSVLRCIAVCCRVLQGVAVRCSALPPCVAACCRSNLLLRHVCVLHFLNRRFFWNNCQIHLVFLSHENISCGHGTHINESWYTYEWVMAHTWRSASCHTYHIWYGHVKHMTEWPCHIHKWVIEHTIDSLMRHTPSYEWVMVHIWMSHGTHMNESWHSIMRHTPSCVCHDSFICVPWLIHMCTMTHS